MPELYIIAQKIFSPIFFFLGGGTCSSAPISYAYAELFVNIMHKVHEILLHVTGVSRGPIQSWPLHGFGFYKGDTK